jgi:glycosyltransferase involved in cell wall biosynthesis
MSSLSLAGARKGGAKKRIAHSHNTGNERLKSKKNRVMAAVLRHKLNREATTRLACGQLAGEFLYGRKKAFTVIHNGIELSRFKYNTNTRHKMREKYEISDDAIVLLNVGRLEEAKNQNLLIDIFADFSRKHQDARLFIIGDGSLEHELEDKIACEYLGDKVTLLPSLDDIEGFYAMADVFVMPSLFEGVPTAGIEAQASGMTCLFSDKVPDEVKILDSTVFLPLNGDWLKYIKPAEKSRADAVKQASVKEYDIKSTVKKLEEVYG